MYRKSEKGITLTSLVIYVIVMLIVLGMLAVIMANLQGNITGVGKEGTKNAEIDKFNVYFLKEVKKQGIRIESISNDKKEIKFTTGNTYSFDSEKKAIYLSENENEEKNIKIAEKIEKCEFSNRIENEKEIIAVTIRAKDAEERTLEYVLGVGELASNYDNESEYINLIPNNWDLSKLNVEKPVVIEKFDNRTYIAPIPRGFTVSQDPTENKIQNGLVIKDSLGNEFVWIPVPEKDMKVATYDDPYFYLYGESTNTIEPSEIKGIESFTGSEIDSQEVLDYWYTTKEDGITPYFNYDTDFAYENHYKEMAESINKYGGFYIGRYETTIDGSNIGSKNNTSILTTLHKIKEGINPNRERYAFDKEFLYRFWGLYYTQRHNNIYGNGINIQTNMIWGQQWKKMISFFTSRRINYIAIPDIYEGPSEELTSGQATYINKEDPTDVIKDRIYNVYDLRSNLGELTALATDYGSRVKMNGDYRYRAAANSFDYYNPITSDSFKQGSRMTLYIK